MNESQPAARNQIRKVGYDATTERALFLLDLDSIDQIPGNISVASKYFVCLIALDSGTVDHDALRAAAYKLLHSGGVYFCTWGPGCEAVHDAIDEEIIGEFASDLDSEHILTTWHEDDPLSDAIWVSLYVTWPADSFFDDCRSVLAVTVASPEWAAEIESAFADTTSFSKVVLEK